MAYERLTLPPTPSDVRTRSALERIRGKLNELVDHANISAAELPWVRPEDYGEGIGVGHDDTVAIQAALNVIKTNTGGTLLLNKQYRCDSGLSISGIRSLKIKGIGADLKATVSHLSSSLIFDNAPSGTVGLTIDDFVGVSIEDIYISQQRSGAGGGTGLRMSGGHDFTIRNVKIEDDTATGYGMELGMGTGHDVFLGHLENCQINLGSGTGFKLQSPTTTMTWDNCYVIGGTCGWDLVGAYYSSFRNCAADAVRGWGYLLNGCRSITMIGCSGELCHDGVVQLVGGSSEITIIDPHGTSNNVDAHADIGDLVHIGPGDDLAHGSAAVVIINPFAYDCNAATIANIYGVAGTKSTTIISGDETVALSKGIDGDATWKKLYLTKLGTSSPAIAGLVDQDLRTTTTPAFTGLNVLLEGGEIFTDGGLEAWTSATDLTNWLESIAGASTVNRESSTIHGGTYSCRLDIDASLNLALIRQLVTLAASTKYRLTFWYKTATGALPPTAFYIVNSGTNVYIDLNGSWQTTYTQVDLDAQTSFYKYTFDFITHASYTDYYIAFLNSWATSSSIYFDDISLVPLVSTSTVNQAVKTTDSPTFDHLHLTSGPITVAGEQVVGTQAAAQADLKANYTTGDLDTEAEIIAALNASNAGHNALLAKLRTHGLIDT